MFLVRPSTQLQYFIELQNITAIVWYEETVQALQSHASLGSNITPYL